TAEAIPKTHLADAAAAPAASGPVAATPASPEAGAVTSASSVQGSEQGAANGTETDPLKARAADMYRAQLAAWFASRFEVRGKIPFETLKTLHASAQVTVTPDRKVGSFAIVKPSGDPTFDAEVTATLERIRAGGAELPPPPPMYPEILGTSLPVGFGCNVKRLCE
ncbi:MAG: TonB C-terminal domain-containing protein, partial [Myxococcota bacterium]|nr:TonB C-terminal domain-containing protein [Myxococcota bacterium]